MPRYRIILTRTSHEYAEPIIDADTEAEAEAKALRLLKLNRLSWAGGTDSDDDGRIISTEEVKP